MNAIKLKSDLHKLIDKATDLGVLQAVKVFLSEEAVSRADWADTLSNTLKEELETSIKEADHGTTLSHANAIQQIKKRYNL